MVDVLSMFNNTTGPSIPTNGIEARASSLILMQVLILIGNLLILTANKSLKSRTVPDILIGSLATVDLLNGLGPVLISVSMYFVHPFGFNGIRSKGLCYCYVWLSSTFRLLGCFVASLMAIDRYIAIVTPLKYKVYLTNPAMLATISGLVIVATIIAALPLLGVSRIFRYGPVCSFDFSSNYGFFIALLGYLQLTLVILCYVGVIKGIVGFLARQGTIKRSQLRASVGVSGKSSDRKITRTTRISTKVGVQKEQDEHKGTEGANNEEEKSRTRFSAREFDASKTGSITDGHTESRQRGNTLGVSDCQAVQGSRKKSSVTFSAFVTTANYYGIGEPGSVTSNPMKSELRDTERFDVTPTQAVLENPKHDGPGMRKAEDSQSSKEDAPLRGRLSSVLSRWNTPSNSSKDHEEAEIRESLSKFKKESATWKNSRKLALVMGIVVFLFYCSWMPIVMCITLSLLTGENSATLQFIAARMSLFSSMMNVFVYGSMLKQYRMAYIKIFKCLMPCCGKKNKVSAAP